MIRVDEIWLSKEPLDMRAGPETCLARVVQRFGAAKPQSAYVFLNKRTNRMKVLVHDLRPLKSGKVNRLNCAVNNSMPWSSAYPGIRSVPIKTSLFCENHTPC